METIRLVANGRQIRAGVLYNFETDESYSDGSLRNLITNRDQLLKHDPPIKRVSFFLGKSKTEKVHFMGLSSTLDKIGRWLRNFLLDDCPPNTAQVVIRIHVECAVQSLSEDFIQSEMNDSKLLAMKLPMQSHIVKEVTIGRQALIITRLPVPKSFEYLEVQDRLFIAVKSFFDNLLRGNGSKEELILSQSTYSCYLDGGEMAKNVPLNDILSDYIQPLLSNKLKSKLQSQEMVLCPIPKINLHMKRMQRNVGSKSELLINVLSQAEKEILDMITDPVVIEIPPLHSYITNRHENLSSLILQIRDAVDNPKAKGSQQRDAEVEGIHLACDFYCSKSFLSDWLCYHRRKIHTIRSLSNQDPLSADINRHIESFGTLNNPFFQVASSEHSPNDDIRKEMSHFISFFMKTPNIDYNLSWSDQSDGPKKFDRAPRVTVDELVSASSKSESQSNLASDSGQEDKRKAVTSHSSLAKKLESVAPISQIKKTSGNKQAIKQSVPSSYIPKTRPAVRNSTNASIKSKGNKQSSITPILSVGNEDIFSPIQSLESTLKELDLETPLCAPEPLSAETDKENLCGPPSDICLKYTTESCISLQWKDPETDDNTTITSYEVEYWSQGSSPTTCLKLLTTEKHCKIKNLLPDVTYLIQLTAVCGDDGKSAISEPVSMKTLSNIESLSRIVKNVSTLSSNKSDTDLDIYNVPIVEPNLGSETRFHHCQFGPPIDPFSRKTILVVGATGSGKSTLIDSMINYILGIRWEDDFRFKITRESPVIQTQSLREHVTVYDICQARGSQISFSLTIIDTPDFGDSRGLERDKVIMENISRYFESEDGIQELNAVCFLVPASLPRLTLTQMYIFDSILSIFGADIKNNIRLMVTFAENQEPPVLAAVKEVKIPCPEDENGHPLHYKFNNSSFFVAKVADDVGNAFKEMLFEMGVKSFQNFFGDLSRMKRILMKPNCEAWDERKRSEVVVEGLQQRIRSALNTVEEFRLTKKALTEDEEQLRTTGNVEFQLELFVNESTCISGSGNFTSNCQKCRMTCHYPCKYPKHEDRRFCYAMDPRGNCRICPGKCPCYVHFNQKFKYDMVKKTVVRSSDELRRKYQLALNIQLTNKELVHELSKESDAYLNEILDLVDITYPMIQRLEEMALRSRPFTAPDFIDLIIASEVRERSDGYQNRIDTLKTLREMTENKIELTNRHRIFDLSPS